MYMNAIVLLLISFYRQNGTILLVFGFKYLNIGKYKFTNIIRNKNIIRKKLNFDELENVYYLDI